MVIMSINCFLLSGRHAEQAIKVYSGPKRILLRDSSITPTLPAKYKIAFKKCNKILL